jgi:transcriptional regulator with XRE-family HTH domain
MLESRNLRDYASMATKKKTTQPKGPPPPKQMIDLPSRLQRAIDKRGTNQVELAARSGVSQPTISNLKNGVSLDGVTAATVAHLSLALRVSPGFLLLGEGDVIPDLTLNEQGPAVVLDEEHHPSVPSAPPPGAAAPSGTRRSRRR